MQVGMASVDMAHEPRLPKVLKMLEGDVMGLAKPGTVLLFAGQAKKLKVKTGDSLVFSVLTPARGEQHRGREGGRGGPGHGPAEQLQRVRAGRHPCASFTK